MLFAMDDLGMSNGLNPVLQTKIAEEAKTVEKKDEVKPSDSPSKEPEVNDVFETSQPKQDSVQSSLEAVQARSTAIDITKESLDKIASFAVEIKASIESEQPEDLSMKKIQANYEKITQVAKETSFNGEKLISTEDKAPENTPEKVSLKELGVSDIENLKINTEKQKEEASAKIDEIIKNIKTKQDELTRKQEEITQGINKNSLVVIKIVPEENEEKLIKEAEKTEKKSEGEKLKDTAVKGIKEEPQKSTEMHIKHIDRNLLLAMISLRAS